MSKPKRGDEHPKRPGWRWDGNQWTSPEAWVNHRARTEEMEDDNQSVRVTEDSNEGMLSQRELFGWVAV